MLAVRFMTFVFFSHCPGEGGRGLEKEIQEVNIGADVYITPVRKHQSQEAHAEAAKNCRALTAEHLGKTDACLDFVPQQLRQFQYVDVKAQVSERELKNRK